MKPDLISVVISTYNWHQALRAAVEGLFRQTDRRFEIVIADDGSGSETAACIEQLRRAAPVPLKHVWQPDLGFRLARSRNRGIIAASGDYIVLLDGDCVPQRDFVERHRGLAEARRVVTGSRVLLSAQASADVLAGRLDLQQMGWGAKLRQRCAGGINKLPQLLWRLPDLGRTYPRFSMRRIKGCNMAMWRSDLEAVNGFDEIFQGWGHEDADLILRLFNAGVLRKDGAFATEVFHLWHREAKRDRADAHHDIVRRRARDRTVRAELGLAEHASSDAA